jgi:hypothetical protein
LQALRQNSEIYTSAKDEFAVDSESTYAYIRYRQSGFGRAVTDYYELFPGERGGEKIY